MCPGYKKEEIKVNSVLEEVWRRVNANIKEGYFLNQALPAAESYSLNISKAKKK